MDINLLKSESQASVVQREVLEKLKGFGFIFISLVLLGAVVTGAVFFIFTQQLQRAEAEKTRLAREIAKEARKEGIYVSLKSRLPVVGKALESQKQWGDLLVYLPQIVAPPNLTTLAVDEQDVATMTIQTRSLDETAQIIDRVIQAVGERRMHNPQLVNLQLLDDGAVELTLSFLPLF